MLALICVIAAAVLSSCVSGTDDGPSPSPLGRPSEISDEPELACDEVIDTILTEMQTVVDSALAGSGTFQDDFAAIDIQSPDGCPSNPDGREELVAGMMDIVGGVYEQSSLSEDGQLTDLEFEIANILAGISVTLEMTELPVETPGPADATELPGVVACEDLGDAYISALSVTIQSALADRADVDAADLAGVSVLTESECPDDQTDRPEVVLDIGNLAFEIELGEGPFADADESARARAADTLWGAALDLTLNGIPSEPVAPSTPAAVTETERVDCDDFAESALGQLQVVTDLALDGEQSFQDGFAEIDFEPPEGCPPSPDEQEELVDGVRELADEVATRADVGPDGTPAPEVLEVLEGLANFGAILTVTEPPE